MFDTLISSGRIVDIMALFVALEIIVMVIYWKRTRRGVAPVPLLMNIGAGGSLMLALRASLTGAATLVIAGFLLASLGFHVADVALRWQR